MGIRWMAIRGNARRAICSRGWIPSDHLRPLQLRWHPDQRMRVAGEFQRGGRLLTLCDLRLFRDLADRLPRRPAEDGHSPFSFCTAPPTTSFRFRIDRGAPSGTDRRLHRLSQSRVGRTTSDGPSPPRSTRHCSPSSVQGSNPIPFRKSASDPVLLIPYWRSVVKRAA